jgi:myo-inositol-1(or 4)-monophosphatase
MTAIDFSSFVDQLATASGDTILPFFRTALAVENKKAGGFDPVTAADRAAEQSMRALIRKQFPDHGILGEEYGSEHTNAEYVWVLDPIDGTKSFISGMLAWGTLIGLMRFGEPVFGMMSQPFTRERFSDKVKLSRYGGDCYAYCMLAAGLIDLIVETEIKPHDIVAIIPIIAGAGGIITTWENGPAQGGGRIVVAGDRRVHTAALEILAR